VCRFRPKHESLTWIPGPGAATHDLAPPPVLVAAARSPSGRGDAVQLETPGGRVVLVVGDEGGDPAEWWQAALDITGATPS
jgi:hypothetical protein